MNATLTSVITTLGNMVADLKEFPKNKLHFPFPQMDVHIAK